MVGKYAEHRDAYKSIYEALDHAGIAPQGARSASGGSAARTSRPRAPSDSSPATTACSCRAVSASAASRAKSRRSAGPANGACPSSGSASACSAPWSSTAATSSASRAPTAPSSTRTRPHPVICLLDEQQRHHRHGGHDAPRGAAGQARRGARRRPARATTRPTSRNGTATVTSSTTSSTASSTRRTACAFSGTSPDGQLVEIVELRRVRQKGRPKRRTPVVPRGAVPPRVQEQADGRPAAVRRLRRRRRPPPRGPRRSHDARRTPTARERRFVSASGSILMAAHGPFMLPLYGCALVALIPTLMFLYIEAKEHLWARGALLILLLVVVCWRVCQEKQERRGSPKKRVDDHV